MTQVTDSKVLMNHVNNLFERSDSRIFERPNNMEIIHVGMANVEDDPFENQEIYIFAVSWNEAYKNIMYVFRLYPEQGDYYTDKIGLVAVHWFTNIDDVTYSGRVKEAFDSRIKFSY